jgi:hypothetical protein
MAGTSLRVWTVLKPPTGMSYVILFRLRTVYFLPLLFFFFSVSFLSSSLPPIWYKLLASVGIFGNSMRVL